MQVLAPQRTKLPKRQQVMRFWLNQLCDHYPEWSRSKLEPLALRALDDFYRFLDGRDGAGNFNLQAFFETEISSDQPSLIEIARFFLMLRSALRRTLRHFDPAVHVMIMDRLDEWSEPVIDRYTVKLVAQLQDHQAEIAQQITELNMLNRCAAALNTTLDSLSVMNATARLAYTLTDADLCIVFQREGDILIPKAHTGCIPYGSEPIQIFGPKLLEPLIVDESRQDVPITLVRKNLGVAQAQAMTCTPLSAGNTTVGKLTAVYLHPQRFTAQQIKLREIFANQAGQALHNAQLYERLGELAAAQERQRIACEMHDTMLQTLVSLNINLQVALKHARQRDWDLVADLIEEARGLGKAAMEEGREALKSLHNGCATHEENLVDAIQPELTLFAEQSGITPQLVVAGSGSPCMPKKVEHHLRRLVGEALNNIYRHSQATEVVVSIEVEDNALRLRVQDNGVGFTPGTVEQQNSFGLNGMRERANELNAQLDVISAPGRGTVISVRVPRESQSSLQDQVFTEHEAFLL